MDASAKRESTRSATALALLLPLVFALLWASSYTAAKIGLAHITPLAFVAVRLTIAAAVAMLIVKARGLDLRPLAGKWLHLIIGGALVHGLSLMTAHAALVTIGATPMALVHAFHPVLTAALGVLLLSESFRWWQWLGVALGFAGVLLAVPLTAPWNVLELLALSLVGLSGGTLYLRRFCADVPPFAGTSVQLIGGALISIAGTVLFETPHAEVTIDLLGAMAWNTVAMSIFGMSLYTFMLERRGAGHAASAFFVVPAASAVIAWAFLGETFSQSVLVGLAAATLGVVLVWWRGIPSRGEG